MFRRLAVESLESRCLLSVAPLNVALVSDAVAQAQEVRAAAAKGTIALVYPAASMTSTGLVDLLASVSLAHNGAPIGHLGFVAHGKSGEIDLGKYDDLSLATLPSQAAALERLRSLLTNNARVDLYACSVAAGVDGKTFVDELSAVTGATVFASDNPVGTVPGADFVWEYRSGQSSADGELFSRQQLQTIPPFAFGTLTVGVPNGGELWQVGAAYTVSWTSSGDTSTWNYQNVALSTDGGVTFNNIGTGLAASARSFAFTPSSSQVSTLAMIRVRAMDVNTYIVAADTSNGTFTIANAVRLPAPTLTAPTDGATGVSTSPTCTWSQVTGNQGYRIIITTNSADLTTDPTSNGGTSGAVVHLDLAANTTSYTYPNTLASGTLYYWEVHAYGTSSATNGYWSQRSFTTVAVRLPAPTLTAPTDGATGVSTSPTCTWSQVTGNQGYRIIITTNSADLTTDPTSNGGTSGAVVHLDLAANTTSYTYPNTLASGTLYYWEVHAYGTSSATNGYWSHRSFTTVAVRLPAPTLTAPTDGATGVSTSPTCTWSQVTGNQGYRIIITTNSADLTTDPTSNGGTSGAVVHLDLAANTTSYTYPNTLASGTLYYWEVHAYGTSSATNGYWSQRSFTTVAVRLPAPTLTAPTDGATGVSTSPTCTWSQVTGNQGYRIIITTNSADLTTDPTSNGGTSGAVVHLDLAANTTSYTYPNTLASGTLYYWEVHAYGTSSATNGYWSQRSFTTVAAYLPAPTLTYPTDGATGISTSPTCTWTQVSGNQGYRIVMSTNSADMTTDPTSSGGTSSGAVVYLNLAANTTSYPYPNTLASGTKYYWEVHTTDATHTGNGYWGQGSFTTVAAYLPAPTLTYPTDGATGISTSPTCTWTQVSGNQGYRIVMSTNSADMTTDPTSSGGTSSGAVVYLNLAANTTSYPYPNTLASGTKYYWEVHTTDATHTGNGYWGQGSFTTASQSATLVLPTSIRVLRTATGTIDTVDFETYVENVLPNEWYASWDQDALRAGALAVKEYAWYWTNHAKYPGMGYDVKDSTADQVYVPGSAAASTNQAVTDTWSLAMLQNGSIFQPQYDSGTQGSPDPLYPGRMSQWGTEYWAVQGKDYQWIGDYYYPNTTFTDISVSGYDRQAALAYAQKYYNYVCSDGYFWTDSSTASHLGAHSPVPTSPIGDDCAHFVSSCVGSEPNEVGGGLAIPTIVPPKYGDPGAQDLMNKLEQLGFGEEVGTCSLGNLTSSGLLADLSAGDVIEYDWSANGPYQGGHHIVLYLGNNEIAAHSASYYGVSPAIYSDPSATVHLIHILGDDTQAPTVSVTSPTAGAVWQTGTSYTVNWSLGGNTSAVASQAVFLSTNGGSTWQILTGTALPASARSYQFTPTAAQVTTSAVVMVSAEDSGNNQLAEGTNSGTFIIQNPVQTPLIVTAADWASWASPHLTLILDGNGNLHLYTTGTTNDMVTPRPLASVANIQITSPSSIGYNLTIDSTAGSPIPLGGQTFSGAFHLGIIAGSLPTTTVTLSGTNTFSGGVTVSAGTLVVTSASALLTGTSLTVGAGTGLLFGPSVSVAGVAAPDESTNTGTITAVPGSAGPASVGPVSSAPTSAVFASAGKSLIQSPATLVAPVILPSPTAAPPSPQRHDPKESVLAGTLGSSAATRLFGLPTTKKIAGKLAWLDQAANGSDSWDQRHKKDVATAAFDAVFAEYGRWSAISAACVQMQWVERSPMR